MRRFVFFQVPSSYLYFLLICLADAVCSIFSLFFPLSIFGTEIKIKPWFNPWLSEFLSMCCLKLGDRAVVTGISNRPAAKLALSAIINHQHAYRVSLGEKTSYLLIELTEVGIPAMTMSQFTLFSAFLGWSIVHCCWALENPFHTQHLCWNN